MLRVVEHGYKLKLIDCDIDTRAVDTPEDLALVERLLTHDPLVERYA